jgi:enoyl-CoA hydratase/carnithine racemase
VSKTYTTIKVKKKQQTAWITLNRPNKMNAINATLLDELSAAVGIAENDNSVRCVVITGEGDKAFSAGADITILSKLTQETAAEFSRKGQQILSKLEASSKPVIAAINGYALGGGLELALACDFKLASDNAIFGLPEMKLGIIPGWGGTQRLPWTVGAAAAKRMILLGDTVNAKEAQKMGLVDVVVPQNRLNSEADELAQKLCGWSPVALKHAKFAVNSVTKAVLESGLKKETSLFALLFSEKETKNRLQSFLGQGNKKEEYS